MAVEHLCLMFGGRRYCCPQKLNNSKSRRYVQKYLIDVVCLWHASNTATGRRYVTFRLINSCVANTGVHCGIICAPVAHNSCAPQAILMSCISMHRIFLLRRIGFFLWENGAAERGGREGGMTAYTARRTFDRTP